VKISAKIAALLGAACGAALTTFTAAAGPPAYATSGPVVDAPERPALLVAAPARMVLLGIARAGRRLVSVGERGIIALSDDDGRTWRQVPAPTSVSLTSLAFANAHDGWVAGHAGIVLRTTDGGEHWTRQLDGTTAAALIARDAAGVRTKLGPALRKLARELVADGADAPLLAVHCFDARRVMVAGANGLLLQTSDGGTTWTSLFSRTDNVTGRNYYAIAARERDVYVAGEQGLLLRSRDGARSFERVATPYDGTFFGVALPGHGRVFVAGLRGHALLSSDGGAHFARVRSSVPVSFSSIALTRDGAAAVLTNQAGQLLTSMPAGRSIELVPGPPLLPLAGVVEAADGALVAVGFGGAVRISAPAAAMKGSL
jgi:photosystem II stability/assembly factor-like uncharacterized protein